MNSCGFLRKIPNLKGLYVVELNTEDIFRKGLGHWMTYFLDDLILEEYETTRGHFVADKWVSKDTGFSGKIGGSYAVAHYWLSHIQ
ncbi:hypothetical protein V6N12_068406 [Hibiscus sabdariffa]|uniref:Uncharacterized protein n=1 Tax=Hibiscus sabdariffa TaxID=183260 RepID=A0ABR2FQ37_9ROSI